VTKFVITLAYGRTAQATADEVRVTDTGALVLSRAAARHTTERELRQWD
jgi:hypothetical protein